jgi:hypothetical protein
MTKKRVLTPFRIKYLNFKVSETRRLAKLKAIEYKGGKSNQCGYDKCPDALIFHHLDPSQKDFGISENGRSRSFEKMKPELDKCILVCSNCHAEIHYKENEETRIRRYEEIKDQVRPYNKKSSNQ